MDFPKILKKENLDSIAELSGATHFPSRTNFVIDMMSPSDQTHFSVLISIRVSLIVGLTLKAAGKKQTKRF